jgi:hypothetical protein
VHHTARSVSPRGQRDGAKREIVQLQNLFSMRSSVFTFGFFSRIGSAQFKTASHPVAHGTVILKTRPRAEVGLRRNSEALIPLTDFKNQKLEEV